MKTEHIIFALCCATAGAGLGCYGMSLYYDSEFSFCKENNSLFETYKLIEEEYPFEYDKSYAEQKMIKGLVEGLENKYAFYNTEEEESEKIVNQHPSSVQTGFQIKKDSNTKCILVTEVKDNSSSESCGLQVGDIITSINGSSVYEAGYKNSIENLVGKDGKELNLTISRNNETVRTTLILENTNNITDKVELLENDIIYYYIDNFNIGGSSYFFQSEIERLCSDNLPEKLIIDLRKNGGGNSNAPLELFDIFDDDVNTLRLVSEKTGKEEIYSTSKPSVYNFETVVLVSEKTLSAAEILTALFQDTGLGTIVGSQTGGKGVYQNVEWLPNKTTVTLVKGYYYVNHVPNYNNVGITPDVVVEMDIDKIGTDEDIQLQKAIDILSN